MTRYMVELNNVPHEIMLYVEELKMYGDITHYIERYPDVLWLESPWDIEILQEIYGVKKVRAPRVGE